MKNTLEIKLEQALISAKDFKKSLQKDLEEVGVEDLESLSRINDVIQDITLVKDKVSNLYGIPKIKIDSNKLDVHDLPVGSKFRVINGLWEGEIIILKNRKYIKHSMGVDELTPDNFRDLEIEILR